MSMVMMKANILLLILLLLLVILRKIEKQIGM